MSEKPKQAEVPAAEVDLDSIEVGKVSVARGLDNASDEKSAQEQIRVMDLMRRAAISMTSPSQWTEFTDGEKSSAYLNGSGGAAVAFLLGLKISSPEYKLTELAGGTHFAVTCQVTVSKDGREWVDHDECTDEHPSCGPLRKKYEGANANVIAHHIKSQICKVAYAGAVGRAVSGWIGCRGMTLDELTDLGLKTERTGKVGMKRGTSAKAKNLRKLTHDQLGTLKLGNKAVLHARVGAVDLRKTKNGKPFAKVGVKSNANEPGVWLTYWAEPDAGEGDWIECVVEAKEYNGKPEYHASELRVVPDPEDSPPADAEPQQAEPVAPASEKTEQGANSDAIPF